MLGNDYEWQNMKSCIHLLKGINRSRACTVTNASIDVVVSLIAMNNLKVRSYSVVSEVLDEIYSNERISNHEMSFLQ